MKDNFLSYFTFLSLDINFLSVIFSIIYALKVRNTLYSTDKYTTGRKARKCPTVFLPTYPLLLCGQRHIDFCLYSTYKSQYWKISALSIFYIATHIYCEHKHTLFSGYVYLLFSIFLINFVKLY